MTAARPCDPGSVKTLEYPTPLAAAGLCLHLTRTHPPPPPPNCPEMAVESDSLSTATLVGAAVFALIVLQVIRHWFFKPQARFFLALLPRVDTNLCFLVPVKCHTERWNSKRSTRLLYRGLELYPERACHNRRRVSEG